MPLMHRLCASCDHEFDVLELHGVSWAVDHPDFDTASEAEIERGDLNCCPECDGVELVPVLRSRLDAGRRNHQAQAAQDYPRFDRGLGLELQSEAHRRQVMKERGLVALEGEAHSVTDTVERWESRDDDDEAQYQRDQARMWAQPDVRRAHDILMRMTPEERQRYQRGQNTDDTSLG